MKYHCTALLLLSLFNADDFWLFIIVADIIKGLSRINPRKGTCREYVALLHNGS